MSNFNSFSTLIKQIVAIVNLTCWRCEGHNKHSASTILGRLNFSVTNFKRKLISNGMTTSRLTWFELVSIENGVIRSHYFIFLYVVITVSDFRFAKKISFKVYIV